MKGLFKVGVVGAIFLSSWVMNRPNKRYFALAAPGHTSAGALQRSPLADPPHLESARATSTAQPHFWGARAPGLDLHAYFQAEAGADIIVAQGTEGGRYVGWMASMALLPMVVHALAPRPVLAAGGIAHGRGLVAALALWAEGVLLPNLLIPATARRPSRHEVTRSKNVLYSY